MIKIFTKDISYLNDENVFLERYSLMPKERKQKIDNMRYDEGKKQSLACYDLLLSSLLSLGIDARNEELLIEKHGKPYFSGLRRELDFSLSHSGTKVMCAISIKEDNEDFVRSIGCDVEKIEKDEMKLAERFFHEKECKYLQTLISDNTSNVDFRKHEFYRLWTLKESFMKTCGLGMALPMNEFAITINKNNSITILQDRFNNSFEFGELLLNDGYCYSYCVADRNI